MSALRPNPSSSDSTMDRQNDKSRPAAPVPKVVSVVLEEPSVPNYGLRLAASSLKKKNHQLQRESLANVKKHLKRLDVLRREAGQPSLFGLAWCDGDGHVFVGGSASFLSAADRCQLRSAMKNSFEDASDADIAAPLSFPYGLPPLAADWARLPRSETQALFRSTLRHLNGGKRVRYSAESKPDAWPSELRFADPETAAALDPAGRSGGPPSSICCASQSPPCTTTAANRSPN